MTNEDLKVLESVEPDFSDVTPEYDGGLLGMNFGDKLDKRLEEKRERFNKAAALSPRQIPEGTPAQATMDPQLLHIAQEAADTIVDGQRLGDMTFEGQKAAFEAGTISLVTLRRCWMLEDLQQVVVTPQAATPEELSALRAQFRAQLDEEAERRHNLEVQLAMVGNLRNYEKSIARLTDEIAALQDQLEYKRKARRETDGKRENLLNELRAVGVDV